MNLKSLQRKAKQLIDRRGGTDSLKADAEELKDIAKGPGSVADKAKRAGDALKDPGAKGPDTPASPRPPAADTPRTRPLSRPPRPRRRPTRPGRRSPARRPAPSRSCSNVTGAGGLLRRESEEQLEVVAQVGELRAQVSGVVHGAGEDESAFERGEDLVGEGGQVDRDGRRMQLGGCFELLQQPGPPVADRGGDEVVVAVAGELALVDERDEQATRLGGGELVGGLLEVAHEGDELFGWVVALGLGGGHEVVEHALVGGGVALEEGASEVVLGREVVKERALRGRRLREDRVDAGRGEAALEHDSLRGVEDSLARGGSVAGHARQPSRVADRLVCLL